MNPWTSNRRRDVRESQHSLALILFGIRNRDEPVREAFTRTLSCCVGKGPLASPIAERGGFARVHAGLARDPRDGNGCTENIHVLPFQCADTKPRTRPIGVYYHTTEEELLTFIRSGLALRHF